MCRFLYLTVGLSLPCETTPLPLVGVWSSLLPPLARCLRLTSAPVLPSRWCVVLPSPAAGPLSLLRLTSAPVLPSRWRVVLPSPAAGPLSARQRLCCPVVGVWSSRLPPLAPCLPDVSVCAAQSLACGRPVSRRWPVVSA